MKINKKDFLNLKVLIEEGTISEKKFDHSEIVVQLKSNDSVTMRRKGSRKYIELAKEENIFLFFKNYDYNIACIDDIDNYIADIFEKKSSRDIIQQYHNNSKAIVSKSQHGLYISSLKEIDIKLNGKVITILPNDGLGYFLFHTEEVEVFDDTIIVGIENYQVVWFAKRYTEFFDRPNILFIVTTPYMLEWISHLENEYIHFGDYDLAGINIYLNKVVPRLQKSMKYSMFIPENIEYLIEKHGSRELYENQKQYSNLLTDDVEVARLVEIIVKYKKGFEQEALGLFGR